MWRLLEFAFKNDAGYRFGSATCARRRDTCAWRNEKLELAGLSCGLRPAWLV
ncbi:hypothetical protein A2U01_0116617, partial [Trifolium medium]|nr:hypothetical protein [Trifolium medium]